jgi:hypothetical protein
MGKGNVVVVVVKGNVVALLTYFNPLGIEHNGALCFIGNKSDFLLELSLEVFEGTLTMRLPAGIVPTVERKTEGVNYWLPPQDYVIIANHFVLRGTGIRFLGSVQDCNNAMQHLFYNVPDLSSHISSDIHFMNFDVACVDLIYSRIA